ncbi:MAG: hypothetical protein V7707_14020 [Motiliproteus sp.]
MINSGVLLIKPYASGYSRLRCFHIVNHLYRSPQLANALTARLREQYRTHLPSGTALYQAVTTMQQEALTQGVTTLPDDEPLTYSKPIKCCPECAAIGYHTPIFDIPWCRFCPVHGALLRRNCPSCRQPWRTLSDLASNSCHLCGTQIPFKELTARGAFQSFDYHKVQEIFTLRTGQQVTMHSGLDTRTHLDTTYPIALNSEFFPSLLNHGCQNGVQSALRASGVKLERTLALTTTVTPYGKPDPSQPSYHRLEIDEIESAGKRNVASRIYHLLGKPKRLRQIRPGLALFDWEEFYLLNGIEQIAYHLWWALVDRHRKGYEVYRRDPTPDLFTRAGLSELPAIPSVKRLVILEQRHIDDLQEGVFLVSRNFAELMYKIELINFFKRVWCFVSHRQRLSSCLSIAEIDQYVQAVFRSDDGYFPTLLRLDKHTLSCVLIKNSLALDIQRRLPPQ